MLVRPLDESLAGAWEEPDPVEVRFEVHDSPGESWLDLWAGDRAVERDTGLAILSGVRAQYLSVHRDGDVAGVIRVCTVPPDDGGGAWAGLSCLTVDPGHRGEGIATLLTRRALAEAVSSGAGRAFSQVLAHNSAAIALHERLGFAVAGAYRYAEKGEDVGAP